jgi:CBS domain-containing membrane protein
MGSGDPVQVEVVARRAGVPRVGDLMRRDFVSVAAGENLLDARRTMQLARLRHLLVVDGQGRLVGILSYRQLQDEVLARAEGASPDQGRSDLRELTVRDVMVATPYHVRPETPADQAARRMLRLHLGCLPVCENGAHPRLVGILTESDLLRAAWWK